MGYTVYDFISETLDKDVDDLIKEFVDAPGDTKVSYAFIYKLFVALAKAHQQELTDEIGDWLHNPYGAECDKAAILMKQGATTKIVGELPEGHELRISSRESKD